MLITETHLTSRSYINIPGYTILHTNHPDNGGHGGTAILFTNEIKHTELEELSMANLQATTIQIGDDKGYLAISAAFFPPKYNNSSED